MCDLICVVGVYCIWSFDVYKIGVCDKIVIENLKKITDEY